MVCLTIERPTGENEEVFGFFQPHSTTALPFDTKTFNNIEGKNYWMLICQGRECFLLILLCEEGIITRSR